MRQNPEGLLLHHLNLYVPEQPQLTAPEWHLHPYTNPKKPIDTLVIAQ